MLAPLLTLGHQPMTKAAQHRKEPDAQALGHGSPTLALLVACGQAKRVTSFSKLDIEGFRSGNPGGGGTTTCITQ